MPKKRHFPPEAETRPDHSRRPRVPLASGPAPKSSHERAIISTVPPPPDEEPPRTERVAPARTKVSKVRPKKRDLTSATIDEVTADLSRDPRSEDDEDT